MKNLVAHLLVLIATFIIAGSYLAAEDLSTQVNPFFLTFLRFGGAVVLLLPVIVLVPAYRRHVFIALPRGMVIGFFYSGFFFCMFEALKTTTALNTGSLYTLVPLMVGFSSWIFLKEKIGLSMMLVYLIGAVGTCWVVFDGDTRLLLSFSLNRGDLIFMGGLVLLCGYSLSMKLLFRNDPMPVLVFTSLVSGAVFMASALWLQGLPWEWEKIQGQVLLNIGYLSVFATLVSSYLLQKTTVVLGPRGIMAYVYLNPACVALLLFLLKGETVSWGVAPGIVLSVSATFVLQKMMAANSY